MLGPTHRLPQRSAAEMFTDREDARARFSAALNDPQPADAYRVLVWYGVGGQGKTALQAEFGRMITAERGRWVNVRKQPLAAGLIDLENPANRNPAQALLSLRLQLAEHGGLRFPAFDLAFARYFGLDQPGKDIRASHPELFRQGSEVLGDILSLADDEAKKMVPGYGLMSKYGAKLAGKGAEVLHQWWTGHGRSVLAGLDEKSIDELAGELPNYLGHDLSEAMAKGVRVVIRVDTHEALWRDRGLRDGPGALRADEWVRRLVQETQGALAVVTGRDKLRWSELAAEWGSVLEQHLLGGLSDEDAGVFLDKCGVGNPEIRRRMIAAARGAEGEGALPYYLDLERETHDAIMASGRTPTPDQFGGDHAAVLARFLDHLDPETERRLRLASYPQVLDDRSLGLMSGRFLNEADTTGWTRFLTRAFVERAADGTATLHRLMRTTLQASEQSEQPDRFRTAHEMLFGDAAGRMSGDDERVTAEDETLLTTAVEHLLVLDERRALIWATQRFQGFTDAARWRTIETVSTRLTPVTETRGDDQDLAMMLGWRAGAVRAGGRYREAEALYDRVRAVQERTLGPEHPDTLTTLNNLALVYSDTGRYGEAEALYDRVRAVQERTLGPEHPDTLTTLNNLALVYSDTGRYGEAEALYDRVRAVQERTLGPEHPDTLTTLHNLARVYRDAGRPGEAEALFDRVRAVKERTLGPEHPHTLTTLHNLAMVYRDVGRHGEAEALYDRVRAADERAQRLEHPHTAITLMELGRTLTEVGRLEAAEALIVRAEMIVTPIWAADSSQWARLWVHQARLDEARGDVGAACRRLARACEVLEKAGVRETQRWYREALEARARLGCLGEV